MPQPVNGRVPFAVPVIVVGLTAYKTGFTETAHTLDVSRYGVRLQRAPFLRTTGDFVMLQYAGNSARFRVVWIGLPGTSADGQAGLAILEGEPFLWGPEAMGNLTKRTQQPPVSASATSARVSSDPARTGTAVATAPAPTEPAVDRSAPGNHRTNAIQHERRANSRFLCDRAVLCWREGERTPLWGKLRDLSAGGCFVETPVPFDAGSAVSLMMMLYGYKIRVRAEVRVCRPGAGMGVCFLAILPEDQAKLQTVLERLAGPETDRPVMLNQDAVIIRQLKSWFEKNPSLSREQFSRLLQDPKKPVH